MRSFFSGREIHRIHIARTIRSVALSVVSVYVPVFLLVLGRSLTETILFFVVFHLSGLCYALFVAPGLIRSRGLVRSLKWYYPAELLFFISLNLLPFAAPVFMWITALIGGVATFAYWVPMNILLIKHAAQKEMGSDLAAFFALPKAFKIIGPLLGALLIPAFGFWPVFALAAVGLLFSYLPLAGMTGSEASVSFDLLGVFKKLWKRKLLFVLEGFDNIIEEAEWFWGIFVFLVIGTLEAPGIVGALEALGGAAFTILVGKYANKSTRRLIPIASIGLVVMWAARFFVAEPIHAYLASLIASFLMTMFLVSYFSMIYRAVKSQDEEEFLILREIPTVLGRMVVFGTILITISELRFFFVLPIGAIGVLLIIFAWKQKQLTAPSG